MRPMVQKTAFAVSSSPSSSRGRRSMTAMPLPRSSAAFAPRVDRADRVERVVVGRAEEGGEGRGPDPARERANLVEGGPVELDDERAGVQVSADPRVRLARGGRAPRSDRCPPAPSPPTGPRRPRPAAGTTLARKNHRFPAADADLLAVTRRTPSSHFAVVSATPSAARSALSVRAPCHRGISAASRRKSVIFPG